ncbi:MAG: ribosome small subunit-dependent GTPase A [Oscillospiraceae bacterium]|jgi:ribosome biogenesis GTPase|nr:ribosome small subunit-dependent GTPase A [Oscillospiraceae bacterium]
MIDLLQYGFTEDTQGADIARITAVHKERYELICERGQIYGKLKPGVYFNDSAEEFPTVGDFVRVVHNALGDCTITSTLPRATAFTRRDPDKGRGAQAVAANFDYVFILSSLNQDLSERRIERYLSIAWDTGATPVVILTKSDLCEEAAIEAVCESVGGTALGARVIPISAATGAGLGDVREYLTAGKTIVILGSSGVGKSSLVNALAGVELMRTSDIREDDDRGRHTTTHRQLLLMPRGGIVIDTPGMRELGMWDAGEGVSEAFADVRDILLRGCRFTNCTHASEPGCAVREAIERGELTEKRWQNYQRLQREARRAQNKGEAMREKQARNKAIAKFTKQNKANERKRTFD